LRVPHTGPVADGSVPLPSTGDAAGVRQRHLIRPVQPPRLAFAGFRIPPEVIRLADRWYLRYGLSGRDREELPAEQSIVVDRVTLFRWVQRFTPLLIDAARPCRHRVGSRWSDLLHDPVTGWRTEDRARGRGSYQIGSERRIDD